MASQTELAADAVLGAGALPQGSSFFGPLSLPSGLDVRDYARMYQKADEFDVGLSTSISTIAQNRANAQRQESLRQASIMESDALAELNKLDVSSPGARDALSKFGLIGGLSQSVGTALNRKYKELDDNNRFMSSLMQDAATAGYSDEEMAVSLAAAQELLRSNPTAAFALRGKVQRQGIQAKMLRDRAYNQKDFNRIAHEDFKKTSAEVAGMFQNIPESVVKKNPDFFNAYTSINQLAPQQFKGVVVDIKPEDAHKWRLTKAQLGDLKAGIPVKVKDPVAIETRGHSVSEDVVGYKMYGDKWWNLKENAGKKDAAELKQKNVWGENDYRKEIADSVKEFWGAEVKPDITPKEAVRIVKDMTKAARMPGLDDLYRFAPSEESGTSLTLSEEGDPVLSADTPTADMRRFLDSIHKSVRTIPDMRSKWEQFLIRAQDGRGYVGQLRSSMDPSPSSAEDGVVRANQWLDSVTGQ